VKHGFFSPIETNVNIPPLSLFCETCRWTPFCKPLYDELLAFHFFLQSYPGGCIRDSQSEDRKDALLTFSKSFELRDDVAVLEELNLSTVESEVKLAPMR
jgi:hypothetical protein